MVGFSGILGTGLVKDQKMIKGKLIYGKKLSRERHKNLSQEEKDKIKEYQRKKYQELVQYKKEALKKQFFVFSLI